jgi:hypothetical protein
VSAKRKPETAAELMARLEADPEWCKRREERDARYRERGRQLAENQAPLVADLRAAGFAVNSVYDLVNSPDPNAIPVLAAHLGEPYHDRIREGLIRALSLPQARDHVGQQMQSLFQSETDPSLQFAIANALSQMYPLSEIEHLQGINEFEGLFNR